MPGAPLNPRNHGTAKLIRDGATLIISSEQVLEALDGPFERCTLVPIYKMTANPPPRQTPILELLSHLPTLIDKIARHCDASASAVRAVLLKLELVGRIRCISANLAVFDGA